MRVLDDVLGSVVADKPPMRSLSNDLVEIRKVSPLGLHTLTSMSADAEQESTSDTIPAPPEPSIHELTLNEATLLIEQYIEFIAVDRFGVSRTVRLQSPFVSTYKCLHNSKLPVVVVVSTTPFVSPITGTAIAGVGLDRDARIFYEIEPALLHCLVDPNTITDEDAIDAFRFLTEEWLVDVTTDATGKLLRLPLRLQSFNASLSTNDLHFSSSPGREVVARRRSQA